MVNITDEDIAYAESILLKDGQVFDSERRNFIKDFNTLDLQAVPGSGKTTVLLAKLLVLERYMPLKNNSGILVLSHTNAAVDEIKERIERYCPKLFQYPNFVGTIQSFVNTFLAVPFYNSIYKAKPFRIDNEIYDEQVEKFYNNTQDYSLKSYLNRQRDGLEFLKSIRLASTSGKRLIEYLNGTIDGFKLKDPNKSTYKSLHSFKIGLLEKGYLHFDDSYTLANYQISCFPRQKVILQKRFKYVFVDEMQDMDTHQYDLLEQLFFDGGESNSIYQRIGDVNQAIFNGFASHDGSIWEQRDRTLPLSGSYRINNILAPIVQRLGLISYSIIGLRKAHDGSDIDIKPHIIVFDNSNKEQVLSQYVHIIQTLQSQGKISIAPEHKFSAIAWRKEHQDVDKLGLSDYWNGYSVINRKATIDYKVLKDYLLLDQDGNKFADIRKNILNAIIKIFRIEGVFDMYNRVYTKRSLMTDLKEYYQDFYQFFKLKIYRWSLGIIRGNMEVVYTDIKSFLPELLDIFKKEIKNANEFIDGDSEAIVQHEEVEEKLNVYEENNIQVEVGSIHSVKGQTHTATLYLESYFHASGSGVNSKSYESQRLNDCFLGAAISSSAGKRVKQTAKMAYVGFSRPTHLLCFAVKKNHFEQYLSQIDQEIWEIVDMTITE